MRARGLHEEFNLEDEICAHLSANGWRYEVGDYQRYDRERALYPDDLIAWVKETQPETWEGIERNRGAMAEAALLDRVRKQLDARGTLEVIRNGVDITGARSTVSLFQPRPAFAMNEAIQARYEANRLRVVRQVRYALDNENSIDLVFFLNGLPVATAELKSDFTQSVGDAIDQYRFDRHPSPKGSRTEPLLSFPRGALVHFAVSNLEAHMTTKLLGPPTRFLPFNQGHEGAAGNPPASFGHPTAYLWERVWERSSWLDLIARYITAQKDTKGEIKTIIFPRYHQLDATRKLVASVREEGPGGKYLIQHSAGSGKTNSIAWSAHFLAELHDASDRKVFDSVIVVSDRKVIDGQLQEAIYDLQRRQGVVANIEAKGGSKSAKLSEALAGDKKIIVCTIQTFPFALEAVQELAATEGKRFAVIADEAHSSQTGEAAAKLKAVLSAEELQALEEGGEVSAEDLLAAQMSARAAENGITYVAFTATPKAKTLEMFGRRPQPELPASETNKPEPFHVYSMQQAIEEGFILDVLQNYTPYKLAFKLATAAGDIDSTEVERKAAMKGIMKWVRLHPYNISQKVEMVVEHFLENVAGLLEGQAKAMVVTSSRQEAVRWQIAINKYIRDRNYSIGTLVAFSGEVIDKASGPDPFTETSNSLNPGLKGRSIEQAFDTPAYQILLVANKFQTGFDQPLLCGMYVDRRLAGIQAVQTLSRLNRSYPGKDKTYVLDFVNSSEEVLSAFKQYHTTAELKRVTDPDVIYDLRAKLDAMGHYDDYEVERLVTVEMNPKATQGDLVRAIEPVAKRLLTAYKASQSALEAAQAAKKDDEGKAAKETMEALQLFRSDMVAFQRLYAFLSQIFDYGNTDIEKRGMFYKRLIPLLKFGREKDGVDTDGLKLTHHTIKSLGRQNFLLQDGDKSLLKPADETGTGAVQDKEKVLLSEIIEKVNDLFQGDLTENDKLVYVNDVLKGKLLESETLINQARSNSKEQFASSPDLNKEIMNAILDALDAHGQLSKQALDSERVRKGLKDALLGPGRLYETLNEE